MPRFRDPDLDLSEEQRKAIKLAWAALRHVVDQSRGPEAFERELMAVMHGLGREGERDYLEDLSEQESFEEDGVEWRLALRESKGFMTLCGWVSIERPLFRRERNGPTRCLVSERAGVLNGNWLPHAAKVASAFTTELSFERSHELLQQLGGMAPSSTMLLRLDQALSELWEEDREQNEQSVRESSSIPGEAVAAAISLDGVMVNMTGSDRAEKKARAEAEGRPSKGPSGFKEAAVGVVSFYDAEGDRIETWRSARMPEHDKATIKAWLAAELAYVRKLRPDLTIVAAADGSANNWGFLEGLDPDVELVDYYHTTEHVHRHLSQANGASTTETQAKFKEAKRLLLEEKDGAKHVFEQLAELRRHAGTEPKSAQAECRKPQPTYFERHHDRMNYAELRERNLPIGTGVTEGTCRYLVVDRLRRSGMRWSGRGGQAVMTLRSLAVSGRFDAAWKCLVNANARRLRPTG